MTCEGLSRCARYGDSINSLFDFSIELNMVWMESAHLGHARDHPEMKTEVGIVSIVAGYYTKV
jgi:hypothetical protein